MSDPEQIERRIDQTRESLRDDIEAVEEKVAPSRVIGRRIDRIKRIVTSVKERLMGSQAAAAGSAASSISDTASTAPAAAHRQAQESHLLVGLVAFGAGYLLSVVLARRRNRRRKLIGRWRR